MITEIVSWNGHTFAPDYEAGFVTASEPRLPGSAVATLERIGAWPVIVALQRKTESMALLIRIVGDDRHALRSQLFRWFDPEDETPVVIVGRNHDGVAMYRLALCQDLRVFGDQQHDTVFVATLTVSGDVRWRSVTAASETWAVTATADEVTLDNEGEDEAYPVLTIKPTSARTGGYAYRRWVPVVWRSTNAGTQYPLLATLATDAIVGAGKMQADGDDLRVLVDGVEAYRWLNAMNTAATKIWFSADFTRAPDLTLKTAIADTGVPASIEFNEADEVQYLPESGILLIDSEAFVYTARNLTDASVTGISRAAKGTAAAAHTIGDDAHWIQHDIYVVYGNATVTAPFTANESQPVFELDDSDNETWVYEVFGQYQAARPGQWLPSGPLVTTGNGGCYTATERTMIDVYTVAGLWLATHHYNAYSWQLVNPCGIVNAAWADGKKRYTGASIFWVNLAYWLRGTSWWTWQKHMLDTPSTINTWEAWSEAAAVSDWSPADRLAIISYYNPQDVEVGTVTVSLNATEVPLVTVNAEDGNYQLAATITNEETGEALAVAMMMDLDSELEIDTDARQVTYLADGSGQFQAVSLSAARRHWLRLLPGENVLRFDDVGTGEVTVTVEWEERSY